MLDFCRIHGNSGDLRNKLHVMTDENDIVIVFKRIWSNREHKTEDMYGGTGLKPKKEA